MTLVFGVFLLTLLVIVAVAIVRSTKYARKPAGPASAERIRHGTQRRCGTPDRFASRMMPRPTRGSNTQ